MKKIGRYLIENAAGRVVIHATVVPSDYLNLLISTALIGAGVASALYWRISVAVVLIAIGVIIDVATIMTVTSQRRFVLSDTTIHQEGRYLSADGARPLDLSEIQCVLVFMKRNRKGKANPMVWFVDLEDQGGQPFAGTMRFGSYADARRMADFFAERLNLKIDAEQVA